MNAPVIIQESELDTDYMNDKMNIATTVKKQNLLENTRLSSRQGSENDI